MVTRPKDKKCHKCGELCYGRICKLCKISSGKHKRNKREIRQRLCIICKEPFIPKRRAIAIRCNKRECNLLRYRKLRNIKGYINDR